MKLDVSADAWNCMVWKNSLKFPWTRELVYIHHETQSALSLGLGGFHYCMLTRIKKNNFLKKAWEFRELFAKGRISKTAQITIPALGSIA